MSQCGACFNGICRAHPDQDSGRGAAAAAGSAGAGRAGLSKLYDELIAKRLVKARMESAAARAAEDEQEVRAPGTA